MCITVFDIVLEGWNLDTKDLTVDNDKSQSRGTRSSTCSFGGENPEEDKKMLLYRNITKKRKRNGHFWAAVTHCQKYPPPPESSLKGKRNHIGWIEPYLETLHWLLFQDSFSKGVPSPQAMGSNKSLALSIQPCPRRKLDMSQPDDGPSTEPTACNCHPVWQLAHNSLPQIALWGCPHGRQVANAPSSVSLDKNHLVLREASHIFEEPSVPRLNPARWSRETTISLWVCYLQFPDGFTRELSKGCWLEGWRRGARGVA